MSTSSASITAQVVAFRVYGIVDQTFAAGAQGTQGTVGLQGPSGGVQGTQGIQGTSVQGIQGTTGIQGTAGSGTQGTTGIQGTQGVQGRQGTTGSGTQGTTGIQGNTGIQGTQGLLFFSSSPSSTSTAYTLSLTDVNKLTRFTSSSAVTVTVPASIFAVNDQIYIQRYGTGSVTFAAGVGVTITSTGVTAAAPVLRARYSSAAVICVAADTFTIIGDIF